MCTPGGIGWRVERKEVDRHVGGNGCGFRAMSSIFVSGGSGCGLSATRLIVAAVAAAAGSATRG